MPKRTHVFETLPIHRAGGEGLERLKGTEPRGNPSSRAPGPVVTAHALQERLDRSGIANLPGLAKDGSCGAPAKAAGNDDLASAKNSQGKRMPTLLLQHIPLDSAYLCPDCNSIGNSARQCPACASEVLMNLSGVLNREGEAVSQPKCSSGAALAA